MVGAMGLRGHEHGDDSDPFWLVTGTPLDAPALPAPVDKERREDLQAWSFLNAVANTTGGLHPIGVRIGADPPDRLLESADETWGLELTELTLQDVRQDLARVRQLGRSLEFALRDDGERFPHLRGRVIVASAVQPENVNDADRPLEAVLEALTQDLGCVGDNVDLSQGLPDHIPPDGFYGQHGGLVLQTYRAEPIEGLPTVVTTSQAQFRRSELLALVRERVEAKDQPGNDLLLISCGLLDARGYRCPADSFLFGALLELLEAGDVDLEPPTNIRAIALHHWPHDEWFELYADGAARPWLSG